LRNTTKYIDGIYRNLQIIHRREYVHRDLIENICDNVLWYNIIKIITLISVVIAQIYLLKFFIDSKTANI
jgi:hypothetical protein